MFWRKFDAKDYAVRHGNEKMILKAGTEKMLFDLELDISEEKNLSIEQNEQVIKLTGDLKKWESELLDPTFTGLMKDKEYNAKHPKRFKKQTK